MVAGDIGKEWEVVGKGSQFGGAGTRENLVAMNHSKVNAYPNGAFGSLEKKWRNLIEIENKKVHVKIECIYDPSNTTGRPDRFEVSETINGVKQLRIVIQNF
ncbi:MAG: DNA/RNA non-specific endonuclease [Spirosomataceae bacterium]